MAGSAPELVMEQGRITLAWGIDADDRPVHLVDLSPGPDDVPYIEAIGALAMAQESLPEIYNSDPDED